MRTRLRRSLAAWSRRRGHPGDSWGLWKSAALEASWGPFFFREELLQIPLKVTLTPTTQYLL